MMKVVSLVPSWTETLHSWGIDLVGRTRYCVHPQESLKNVPVVGGTKNPHFLRINNLQPDVVVVDREENTRDVLQGVRGRIHDTHVRQVVDMPDELSKFAKLFGELGCDQTILHAIQRDKERWQKVLQMSSPAVEEAALEASLPGVLHWLRQPDVPIKNILYVIWKEPWMIISPQTYIGSMLSLLGYGEYLPAFTESYPSVTLQKWLGPETLLLFSSEPYPFGKYKKDLPSLATNPMAIVDGESFSWFGSRSLSFLENSLGVSSVIASK